MRPSKGRVALTSEPEEWREMRRVDDARQNRRGVTHFQKLGHKLVSFTFTNFLQGLASPTAEIPVHNSVHCLVSNITHIYKQH